IAGYLLFPEFDKLPLKKNEIKFVRTIYSSFALQTYACIRRIVRFYGKYSRVYNKYKHGLSAIVGLFQLTHPGVRSHIYLRDEARRRSRKKSSPAKQHKKRRIITLVIPTDLASLEHYQSIVDDINHVFIFLILSHLYNIHRAQRPYLLDEIRVDDSRTEKYAEIVAKVNGIPTRIEFKVGFNFIFPDKAKKKMLKVTRRDFIYVFPHDMIASKRGQNIKYTIIRR
ncbi:MAG: hypothetical protein ACREBU_06235, partial [Nitrososphaera sp.]